MTQGIESSGTFPRAALPFALPLWPVLPFFLPVSGNRERELPGPSEVTRRVPPIDQVYMSPVADASAPRLQRHQGDRLIERVAAAERLSGSGSGADSGVGRGGMGASSADGIPPVAAQTQAAGIEHNLPSIRNPCLVGREEELRQLRNFFATWTHAEHLPIAILTGIAGVGKSQIALEYAYSCLLEYRKILWIDASGCDLRTQVWRVLLEQDGPSVQHLSEGLADEWATAPSDKEPAKKDTLARPADSIPDEGQVSQALQETLLKTEASSLLILDGLEYPEQLMPFLARLKQTHILITSCRRDISSGELFTVRELTPADAAALVAGRQSLARRERASVQTLCAELGHLPLALSAAARIVDRKERPPSELLADVRREGALRWLGAQSADPSLDSLASLTARLERSYERLSDPARLQLARLVSVLHGTPVCPQELVTACADSGGAAAAVAAALAEMIQAGFIQPFARNKFSANPLIVQFLKRCISQVDSDSAPASS